MPAIAQKIETVRAELESFRAQPGSDGWGFGKAKIRGASVPVVGKLLGIHAGDECDLTGSWVDHAKFGRQFKVTRCEARAPDSDEGIVKWLASRLPNVGEPRARALVQRWPNGALWEVIEQHPELLTEVNGITPARAADLVAAYKTHRAERDGMIKLRGWGLTDSQVSQCLATWKKLDEVLRNVQEDPYQLATFVHGFGFLRADVVARKMGMPMEAPARIRAGLDHMLNEARGHGHVYVPYPALVKMAASEKCLNVKPELVELQVKEAVRSQRIVQHRHRMYTPALDKAEGRVATALLELLAAARTGEAAA